MFLSHPHTYDGLLEFSLVLTIISMRMRKLIALTSFLFLTEVITEETNAHIIMSENKDQAFNLHTSLEDNHK